MLGDVHHHVQTRDCRRWTDRHETVAALTVAADNRAEQFDLELDAAFNRQVRQSARDLHVVPEFKMPGDLAILGVQLAQDAERGLENHAIGAHDRIFELHEQQYDTPIV